MKSTALRNFQVLFTKHDLLFFRESFAFHQFISPQPKGCKLTKIIRRGGLPLG